jgi:hypothetical protein
MGLRLTTAHGLFGEQIRGIKLRSAPAAAAPFETARLENCLKFAQPALTADASEERSHFVSSPMPPVVQRETVLAEEQLGSQSTPHLPAAAPLRQVEGNAEVRKPLPRTPMS